MFAWPAALTTPYALFQKRAFQKYLAKCSANSLRMYLELTVFKFPMNLARFIDG